MTYRLCQAIVLGVSLFYLSGCQSSLGLKPYDYDDEKNKEELSRHYRINKEVELAKNKKPYDPYESISKYPIDQKQLHKIKTGRGKTNY